VLEPGQRRLLTEALRPPDGYELDHAIATTFSLDLLALLITPLSFALFDWESGEGGVTRNPDRLPGRSDAGAASWRAPPRAPGRRRS
jgi:hypothetical protein